MRKETIPIDDPWVLSRAGHSSPSFSNFLRSLAPMVPEKKAVEKAATLFEPGGMDKLGIPTWIRPLTSKIMEQVSHEIGSELIRDSDFKELTGNIFGTGISSLTDALYEVAKERGVTNEGILHLIKILPEFEALLYFMNARKFYRDHCAHQLRVAVLGDFLLDLKSGAGDIEGLIKDQLELSQKEVRTAWWLTGLLHDTGIPLAELSTAINWSLLNEMARCYPSIDIEVSQMSINLASNKLGNQEYLSVLVDNMPSQWQEIVRSGLGMSEFPSEPVLFKAGEYLNREYEPRRLQINHGVAGAVNLLRTLGPPEKLRKNLPEDKPLIEAAKAIALHNLKSRLGEVPFEDNPLTFLLILSDELQEWSRPVPVPVKDTYFTTSLQKITLLDSIFYTGSNEFWDIPYTNREAKRLASFDFKRVCTEKADTLKSLNCSEQFPESEVQLRDVKTQKPRKEDRFTVEIKTK